MTPEKIAEIHAACFPDRPWSADEVRDLLSRPAVQLFSASGTYLIVQVIPPEAEILSIGTLPDMQRNGLAKSMLQTAARDLASGGVSDLHLEVRADNEPALTLYRRLGFCETGRRPAYYMTRDGTRVDAVLMKAALPLGHTGAAAPD